MKTFDLVPAPFTVSDFLNWQRDGGLDLDPDFQRRSVWRPDAKSYLIDTVVRGLPVPLIFIREQLDLTTQTTMREVVDGQQRLRTLFSFIDPSSLDDFDADRDDFTVRATHNPELAGRTFDDLEPTFQTRILTYKFSVQILPPEMEDREILQIFARLNSTGTPLNHQELRNARYAGDFKATMYDIAYEHFERWLTWRVFSPDQLSRMREVELTSDLVANMLNGLSGRSQQRLNNIYEKYEDDFPRSGEVERRFRRVMGEIEDLLGDVFEETIYSSEIHFFTLFVYLYDRLWGLGSPLQRRASKSLPQILRRRLLDVSERFVEGKIPKKVQDAVARASTDFGRRWTRLEFMRAVCGG